MSLKSKIILSSKPNPTLSILDSLVGAAQLVLHHRQRPSKVVVPDYKLQIVIIIVIMIVIIEISDRARLSYLISECDYSGHNYDYSSHNCDQIDYNCYHGETEAQKIGCRVTGDIANWNVFCASMIVVHSRTDHR